MKAAVWMRARFLAIRFACVRKGTLNMNMTLASSILIMLFASAAGAQNTNPSKPSGRISPGQSVGNPAKLPPKVKAPFKPDLRLRGAESVEVSAEGAASYHKVVFLFQNWDRFPADIFQPAAEPHSLPPGPCKQVKSGSRLFAVLRSESGQILGCTALIPKEDFYFLLEKGKPLPDFVYVDVLDRVKDATYRSSLVSPLSGTTK
jgi:hypothetical protein